MMKKGQRDPNTLAWAMACAILWLWTWKLLANEWRLNDQYQFGFAVPILAAYLGWLRLEEYTPAPANYNSKRIRALSVVAIVLFLLGEIVREEDPTWRLAGWLLGSGAMLLLMAWLLRCGGVPLLKCLAYPLAFNLLAFPWPSFIETPVTQKLLYIATYVSTDLVNWLGVAALQHGNVIELSNGWVGVDTACSGIQSFQASLMVTLFLGEFFRLSFARRITLLFLGWIIALIGNLTRITILTILVAHHGTNAFDQNHNQVGSAATLGIFAMILLAGWLLSRHSMRAKAAQTKINLSQIFAAPGKDGFGAAMGVALVPCLAWAWFAFTPGGKIVEQREALWRVNTNLVTAGWATRLDGFTPLEHSLLHFSQGLAMDLKTPSGTDAYLLHLFWQPQDSVPTMAYSHSPDICLRSAGWQMYKPPDPVTFRIHGQQLQGGIYHFKLDREEQAVLQLVWQGGEMLPFKGPLASVGDRGGRLSSLWSGPRKRGHEIITVYMPPQPSTGAQVEKFQELLTVALSPTQKRPSK